MHRLVFILLKISLALNFQKAQAIECYECGLLSIIPSANNTNCYDPLSQLKIQDNCAIDLTKRKFSGFDAWENESKMRAVCYFLRGEFRNETILMRGCDVMEMSDANKCFDGSLKVWFDTERGREYINYGEFCTCTEDFCNNQTIYSNCPKTPFVPKWLLMFSMIISLTYCYTNPNKEMQYLRIS